MSDRTAPHEPIDQGHASSSRAGHLDVPVPMRWSDIDGYGHVNNATMLRLLEEARIRAFWRPSDEQVELGAPVSPTALPAFAPGSGVHTIVASNRVEYLRELGLRQDGVIVRLGISRIGGASMTLDYQVLTRDDPAGENPYAIARTVLVMVSAQTRRPVRLDDDVRAALAPYTMSPLAFRD